MGPPLSPQITRRSGRRSAPSTSTSTSKSPDSDQPQRQKDTSSRSAMSSTGSSTRNRRPKQDDYDDAIDERTPNSAPSVTSNSSTQGASTSKGKRKGKEKDKQPLQQDTVDEEPPHDLEDSTIPTTEGDEEEEQGITRCICGSSGESPPSSFLSTPRPTPGEAEDDPDTGEFMIQCETCKVWQHGVCMGYQSEKEIDDAEDYFCEECKPELHVDLLRRLHQKKGSRGQGGTNHSNSANAKQHASRSNSPNVPTKQSRRRNTMNSRDAEVDETLKIIMAATAAEAAAKDGGPPPTPHDEEPANGDADTQINGKKKRKRMEDDLPTKKRTRSASTTSDRPASVKPREETPQNSIKAPSEKAAPSKPAPKGKRGGRKVVATEAVIALDGEEAVIPATSTSTAAKRGGNRKAGGAKSRPPLSHATSHNSSNPNQEHGRRTATTNGPADSRAYRNSHAYVVSQQPLLTTWGLPDYLAHLEHILPTNTPQPLEVPAGGPSGGPSVRGDSADRTMERGVKVKWPSKRMSVGDMNKRVRALVEWVGREQATALDRERRREALEKELKKAAALRASGSHDDAMMVDVVDSGPGQSADDGESRVGAQVAGAECLGTAVKGIDKEASASTMKQMEELMEELIGFQERFGPGAKSRDRERRQIPVS